MAYVHPGGGALDYCICRYGKSKLRCRGPRRRLTGPYIAALGGTETYGKFVARPWPQLVEERLGLPVANFSSVNAGVDLFLSDPHIITIADAARATVVQLSGPQNLTNPFYAVHPRRNDRFLRATVAMHTLFREVDFTEFNFTRHMLTVLADRFPERFGQLAACLRATWQERMLALLGRIRGPVVLLWIGSYGPGAVTDPVPLDAAMVTSLAGHGRELLRVDPSMTARMAGTAGMWFGPLEEPAAAEMPGPMVHAEVADAVARSLVGMI
ncbi:DUF6473 family protein [Phaeovulum sp.]|uniref:DUF6473 family protein n=1 Tax=Phaeovulum sp. TaxID=2934796 RepID=UPI003563F7D0